MSSIVKVAIGQRVTDTSHQWNTYIGGMLILDSPHTLWVHVVDTLHTSRTWNQHRVH